MNSKKALLLLSATFTLSANAGLYAFVIENFMQKVFTDTHSEGLPRKVQTAEAATEYRENFMEIMGISMEESELGIEVYKNNTKGLALIKRGNDEEPAFLNVVKNVTYNKFREWKNGPDFIEALEEYTKENGCIPKITSVSHGWRSSDRPGEGSGLSGSKGINGIFATSDDLPSSLGKMGTRSIEKDLSKAIAKGKVKFCGVCVAQFYACNISTKFAKTFSQVSGCQTVVATGQNSPHFKSFATSEDKKKVYEGAHYWSSGAGVWDERQTPQMKEAGEMMGTWFRATPLKSSTGSVVDIVEENLGSLYIAL